MRRFFDEGARAPSRGNGDTELTLGSGTLLAVFFGLVLLCGLCFGLGYALGNHGSKGTVFQSQTPAAGPGMQAPASAQQGKPSASGQAPVTAVQPVAADQTVAGAPAAAGQVPGQVAAPGIAQGAAVAAPGTSPAAQPAANPNPSGWHVVQPAMPGGNSAAQSAQPAVATQVQPAIPGQGTLMVQIASLSNQGDADVLIGALRRRGYAVSAVRYPADNLIHVCVGPFSNRVDANSMKQKLLSDGYNAQVVP